MKASFFGCSILCLLGMAAAFSQGFIKTPESLAFVKSTSIIFFAFACCVQKASPFEIPIHKEITQELENEKYAVGGLQLSFGQSALDEVKSSNANTDIFGAFSDWYHFDNERFSKASQKILDDLKAAQDSLLQNPPDGRSARKSFGTAVHTLQDFYSHSNWADTHTGIDIHPELGTGVLSNPPIFKSFCDNSGNLLPGVDGLTSGYFEMPCKATPEGKCHHGFKGFPHLPLCPYRAGINKDDAPRALHNRAKKQAIKVRLSASF
jgi:hypothetical protein